jgi:type I restriction enzyme R subunit
MSEFSYVEKPVLDWLCGTPGVPGLGWVYRHPKAMEGDRDVSEAIVVDWVRERLRILNPVLDSDARMKVAVDKLRATVRHPDPLAANQGTLALLRDGFEYNFGGMPYTIRYVALEPDRRHLNRYDVTNQYTIVGQSEKTKKNRADSVLLVNGIPLVVAEFKSDISSGHDWREGVNQLHRYMEETPILYASNLFALAADEFDLRVGPVAFGPTTQDERDKQRDSWGPWLSRYPGGEQYWTSTKAQPTLDAVGVPVDGHMAQPDAVREGVLGLLRPEVLLDILEHFLIFESKPGRPTIKKLARYQQYEAANRIVDRVVEGTHNSGLIWHTQGSGKTLTMFYTAQKLRRRYPKSTVLIVVDRTDLKTQVAQEFDDADYPGVATVFAIKDLKSVIIKAAAGTFVTTVQCFQQMDKLRPSQRDDVFLLVDEAHRSQKGSPPKGAPTGVAQKQAAFAVTMRHIFPKARRFGFTGTPIDRTLNNTHREFGPEITLPNGKREQERYLSYYGIKRAIIDGATLPVTFLPHYIPIGLTAEQEAQLSEQFEATAAELEVTDAGEKSDAQRRETVWAELARREDRVAKVIEHMLPHFLEKVAPGGFKAQMVCVNRRHCVTFKKMLDAVLTAQGLPTGMAEVVYSDAQNDDAALLQHKRPPAETARLLQRFKYNEDEWRAYNKAHFGNEPSKWEADVKILIVCDRLLTGFDAPIEQVMYLDKPLRNHNLLQAIARTNRPNPRMRKRMGVVVDYCNVFKDLDKALHFDEKDKEDAVISWDRLRDALPGEIVRCEAFLDGIDLTKNDRETLLAVLRHLLEGDRGDQFATQFLRTKTLWEALAPDPVLHPLTPAFGRLCGIYFAWRKRRWGAVEKREELAQRTREMLLENSSFIELAQQEKVYTIGANYLVSLRDLPTARDRAAALEAALVRELGEDPDEPEYRKLGERMRELVKRKAKDDATAIELLDELQQVADGLVAKRAEPERLGFTERSAYRLFCAIRDLRPEADEEVVVAAAKHIHGRLANKAGCFSPGWWENNGGRNGVAVGLQSVCWDPEVDGLSLWPVGEQEPPFRDLALEALSRGFQETR